MGRKKWDDPFEVRQRVFPLPPGTLSPEFETPIAQQALRIGVPKRAAVLVVLNAVGGICDKRSRFMPYVAFHEAKRDAHMGELFDAYAGAWGQAPIPWTCFVATPGSRKTALLELGYDPVRQVIHAAEHAHKLAVKAWERDDFPGKPKKPPPEPSPILLDDSTLQGADLQLSRTDRGLGMVRDELATWLAMGLYSGGGRGVNVAALAERAQWNRKKEGMPNTVTRATREKLLIACDAVAICGAIPPSVITLFKGLEKLDGLFERIIFMLLEEVLDADPTIIVEGWQHIVHAIQRLATIGAQNYVCTLDGAKLIKKIEDDAKRDIVKNESVSALMRSAGGKLHGTVCCYALLIHLLENPYERVIPTDTIRRASRLVQNCLLPETLQFFEGIADRPDDLMLALKRFILGYEKGDIIAPHVIKRAVRATRPLKIREMNEALDPFIAEEWLEPEIPGPNCKRWKIKAGLRERAAAHIKKQKSQQIAEAAILDKILRGERGE